VPQGPMSSRQAAAATTRRPAARTRHVVRIVVVIPSLVERAVEEQPPRVEPQEDESRPIVELAVLEWDPGDAMLNRPSTTSLRGRRRPRAPAR
jgi:hypothetical protein